MICINDNVWITPTAKAAQLGISVQAVQNKITRGTLKSWYIPHLNITLVKK